MATMLLPNITANKGNISPCHILHLTTPHQVSFLSKLSVLHGAKQAAANNAAGIKMADWLYKVDKLEICI